MAALQLVASASGGGGGGSLADADFLDSFAYTPARGSGMFDVKRRLSIVLLAPVLMAWNRDEASQSFSGFTAAAAAAGSAAGAGDEATFRALLVRQLQGLLGGGAKPAWRKNHRGELCLHLD